MTGRNYWRRVAAAVVGAGIAALVTVSVEPHVTAAGTRPPAVQASGGTRSVMDGVYTGEQAARGRAQYRTRCVLCHLDNGQDHQAAPFIPGESLEREGEPEAPPVAGEAFLKKWTGRTVRELFEITATTMPLSDGGSLSPQQYADVVAYLFELNEFPTGKQELAPAAGRSSRGVPSWVS
jgi:cytochrome c